MHKVQYLPNMQLCNLFIGVDCGDPPELENGRISNLSMATVYNSIAFYECIDGYHFQNDNTSRMCLLSGNWSDESIQCGECYVPTNSCDKPIGKPPCTHTKYVNCLHT